MKQKKISDRCVSNGENIASGNYEFDRVLRRERERERERVRGHIHRIISDYSACPMGNFSTVCVTVLPLSSVEMVTV